MNTIQKIYPAYAVIRWRNVTGIITKWFEDGRGVEIMFEDGKTGVEFSNYPTTALYRFAVIG